MVPCPHYPPTQLPRPFRCAPTPCYSVRAWLSVIQTLGIASPRVEWCCRHGHRGEFRRSRLPLVRRIAGEEPHGVGAALDLRRSGGSAVCCGALPRMRRRVLAASSAAQRCPLAIGGGGRPAVQRLLLLDAPLDAPTAIQDLVFVADTVLSWFDRLHVRSGLTAEAFCSALPLGTAGARLDASALWRAHELRIVRHAVRRCLDAGRFTRPSTGTRVHPTLDVGVVVRHTRADVGQAYMDVLRELVPLLEDFFVEDWIGNHGEFCSNSCRRTMLVDGNWKLACGGCLHIVGYTSAPCCSRVVLLLAYALAATLVTSVRACVCLAALSLRRVASTSSLVTLRYPAAPEVCCCVVPCLYLAHVCDGLRRVGFPHTNTKKEASASLSGSWHTVLLPATL